MSAREKIVIRRRPITRSVARSNGVTFFVEEPAHAREDDDVDKSSPPLSSSTLSTEQEDKPPLSCGDAKIQPSPKRSRCLRFLSWVLDQFILTVRLVGMLVLCWWMLSMFLWYAYTTAVDDAQVRWVVVNTKDLHILPGTPVIFSNRTADLASLRVGDYIAVKHSVYNDTVQVRRLSFLKRMMVKNGDDPSASPVFRFRVTGDIVNRRDDNALLHVDWFDQSVVVGKVMIYFTVEKLLLVMLLMAAHVVYMFVARRFWRLQTLPVVIYLFMFISMFVYRHARGLVRDDIWYYWPF